MLIIGRFLQGLRGCAGMVVNSAMVHDRMGVREAARVFSLLILVMGLAPILAPLRAAGANRGRHGRGAHSSPGRPC